MDVRFNTCVDYLKVRFDGVILDEIPSWLSGPLAVNDVVAFKDVGGMGYKSRLIYGEGLAIHYGGIYTRNASGEDTWILELKGSGCRRFEERLCYNLSPTECDDVINQGWTNLFKVLLEHGGRCTRIDLPIDDFSNTVPFDELKDKIARRSYVSNLRKFSIVDDQPSNSDEPALITTSNKGGYTATLGSRERAQLCIYNKLAERLKNGNLVNTSSWIRYESRFYKECSLTLLPRVYEAFKDKKESAFIAGLLKGLVRFVDRGRLSDSNLHRGKTWKPWEEFLESVAIEKTASQARVESTLCSNAQWLDLDASKAIARLVALKPDVSRSTLGYLVNSGVSKLTVQDLQLVNAELIKQGLPTYCNVEEMIKEISDKYHDVFFEPSSHIEKLFLKGRKLGSAKYESLRKEENYE